MPRPIWSGSISFGLVNVPVKLFSAVTQQDVRFHQLRKSDGSRIRQKRVSAVDGEEVPYEEIVKGYEVGPEQYVRHRARGARRPRPEGDADDRHRGVRRPRPDRPDLLRAPVLPGARQAGREGRTRSSSEAMAGHQQGGHRPVRDAHQAVPGRAAARAGWGAGAVDHALRRRGRAGERAATASPGRTSSARSATAS